MQLSTYFLSIPDVVWSGLLASALTLAGVMLSNRSNTKRLLKQLTHDSEEKSKERINELRKDVYLKIVEELPRVGSFLGSIPQLDPTKEKVGDGLAEFFAVAAKLQLVSQHETSKLAGELVSRYGEILMNLLGRAAPIHSLSSKIQIASDFYERNQTEINRIVAEMTQLNESGESDPVRFSALQRSFEIAKKAADHFAESRSKSYEERAKLWKAYNVTLFEEMRSVGKIQMQLVVSIRSEFSLETNMDEFETLMKDNFERIDQAMKKFMDQLEKR